MKREEALAKFREEEQNYIDGIKAGFLVKIQENATTMYLWVKYTTASRVYIHLVAKAVRIESAMG